MRNIPFNEAMRKLVHQTQTGPVQVQACAHQCGEIAIDGMECEKCLVGHLGTLVGTQRAQAVLAAAVTYHAAKESDLFLVARGAEQMLNETVASIWREAQEED